MRPPQPGADQAQRGDFRVLLLAQLIVALALGLATFLAPTLTSGLFGYPGRELFYYRLAGAATLGYAVMAWLAYRERTRWRVVRIPLVATLTFNAAATLGSLLSLADGDTHWPVFFVLGAATLFTIISGYWLRRDEGPGASDERPVAPSYRIVLVLATLAAAFFGLGPLLLARGFATVAGFSMDELFLLRQAAAATLGYAAAGVLEIRATTWALVRLPTVGALVFNALSAVAAALYLLEGGSSPAGALILIAATFFSVAFGVALIRHGRMARDG